MSEYSDRIGQLFIIGFSGEEPSEPFLSFLTEENIGGVILFEDNCSSHNQAKENIERIHSVCRYSTPFVAIDQEGGRVCRLRGAPAEFRAASKYGQEGDVEHFCEEYSRAAVCLESLGFNLNLAPVCDIDISGENDCLDQRCFGSNADIVSTFVKASVVESRKTGMLSCLKHFPGLGASTIDPHRETATGNYDELIWEQRECLPFAAGIAAGADLIMTTHLYLPRIDETIVTGSRQIISSLIRQRLSFDGPVITDDLTMTGAAKLGDIGERTVRAFNAGHDLLLFGQDFDKATRAYDYFQDAFRRREIDITRLRESLDRISGIKFKLDRSVIR